MLLAQTAGPDCERYVEGLLGQPTNSITSLAFLVAAIAILAGRRTRRPDRQRFGGLVAATGVGSWIQHGPNPAWADLAHDLPLVALVAFVAVDAASDLAGRRLPDLWWVVPTLAAAPLIDAAPLAADVAQGVAAAAAIGLSLQRAWLRPEIRSAVVTALVLLTVGSAIGTLSRSGWPLCRPGSLVQGHAIWHVFAAAAMWRLTPVVGRLTRGDPTAVLSE